MSFAGKVWRLLVGIKDGMVLVFMLLFFVMLFGVLSARPSPAEVREGALLIELDGFVVEERAEIDPFNALLTRETPVTEHEAHDLVRAIDAAASDERIKAVVLDLTLFLGGGQVHMQDIGEALERVRSADKPVFTYGFSYSDDAMMLAAHADEVWLDPVGGAIITGPGGNSLYYGDLLDRLQVNARVYRVGTHKAAVEPYTRNSMSELARENIGAIYTSLWQEWQAHVTSARPQVDIDRVTNDLTNWIEESNGDLAEASLAAGLVDKLGDRAEFGERVAEVAGEGWDDTPGSFAATELAPWLAANPASTDGKKIGIVTVAGEIVDGDAGPGTAGGSRIADQLDKALDDDLAGLVVRVDSPGGSMLASEVIRRAILRHKDKDIPIAVSFANLAASGGYWVATAGDQIFAEPETVTGSIGVFAVLPTFEGAAQELGVSTDGIATTPLSGQPDIIGGLSPEVDALFQSSVKATYANFIEYVAEARGLSPERVDEIGQGQVWDGGTARQFELVDQFGGLDEAVAWVAKEAELEEGEWHAARLRGSTDPYQSLIRQMLTRDTRDAQIQGGMLGLVSLRQQAVVATMASDLDRLLSGSGIQAYCLTCPRQTRAAHVQQGASWMAQIRSALTQH